MKILFTRHGETDYNKNDIILGTTDLPLNSAGIAQATAVAEEIALNYKPEIIYSSPLIRAFATSKQISERIGVKIITDRRLSEWNYGKYEGKGRYHGNFQAAKSEFGVRMGVTGETLLMLAHRVYSFLDEIISKSNYQNILIVSHGGVSRVFKAYFEDVTNDEYKDILIKNCEVWEFNIKAI
ncbi:MAG: histidine phosphatase family protein [Eubacterium sp.]|jgi:probable phosphoglycerate mutase|nr:histidine phosphatase family protein [Eubacterium sp.]